MHRPGAGGLIRKNKGERFESFELLAEAEILWNRRFGTVCVADHGVVKIRSRVVARKCLCSKNHVTAAEELRK